MSRTAFQRMLTRAVNQAERDIRQRLDDLRKQVLASEEQPVPLIREPAPQKVKREPQDPAPALLPVKQPEPSPAGSEMPVLDPEATLSDGPRIINLPDVYKLTTDPLPLSARFQKFFRNMPKIFKMIIWGSPGSGKSTFVLDLANELASLGYGKVLYMAAEEKPDAGGFRNRAELTGANSPYVDILDSERLEDLEQVLRSAKGGVLHYFDGAITPSAARKRYREQALILHPDRGGNREKFQLMQSEYERVMAGDIGKGYWAVIVDSVNQVTEDSREMIALAKRYPHLSWIFIAHAVKDGRMFMGRSKFEHFVDVVVSVRNGIASTDPRKNRFGAPATLPIFKR